MTGTWSVTSSSVVFRVPDNFLNKSTLNIKVFKCIKYRKTAEYNIWD